MNNKKQKSGGKGWGILAILIIILIRGLSSGSIDRDAAPAIIVLIVIGTVIAIAVSSAKKRSEAAKHAHEQREVPAGARPTPTVQTSRPVPSMQRREPVTAAKRSFPQPDAYCVTCENTGEDHFVRDRNRRIAQLDEWLKNGLIDREEYRVLKYRFERDQ
ncbi:MAG: hypothetical protein IK149_08150 [Oscillospiraceae bacterium]|nr:hypothetical protein [Oscillospiraceae bacterium]